MENKSRMQRQNVITLIMNIVIVVLCVILLFTGFKMVEELVCAFSYSYEEESLERHVENGRYAWLTEAYHVSEAEGRKAGKTLTECYGVAQYFEAASMYKAFETVGDTERAALEQDKMERAYEQMGGWNIVKDDIHRKLGLE